MRTTIEISDRHRSILLFLAAQKRLKQIDDLVSIMPVFPLEKKEAETAARVNSDLGKAGKLIGNQVKCLKFNPP